MHGKLIVIYPERTTETVEYDEPIPLKILQGAVGGYIELVPMFTTYGERNGPRERCVAFCDEDGKLKDLPVNFLAQALWQDAIFYRPDGSLVMAMTDVLVGPIAIVTGDDEFMAEL